MKYSIIAFYKFVPLTELDRLKTDLLRLIHQLSIKGTIILAEEGINGTIAGTPESIETIQLELMRRPGLEALEFKLSYCDFNPFQKAKVKVRPEIVTLGVGNIETTAMTGEHVSPEAWNRLLQDEDVLVIDTRNDYEVALGTFKNAYNPETENFRDLPSFVAEHLNQDKDKKIAMFCTGGIRCEKSTAFLKQAGFKSVYQLDGGILNYLAKIPQEDSMWIGDCFVFDNRVAVDHHLTALPPGSIDLEWKNNCKKQTRGVQVSDPEN